MTIELRNSDRLTPPVGYSHASIAPAGRIVHLAGQLGMDADGTITEGLAAQTEQALLNFVDALAAAGATPENLVKMNVLVVGWLESMQGELFAGMGAAAQRNPLPQVPITLIGVESLYLDAALIEIEGVAVLSP